MPAAGVGFGGEDDGGNLVIGNGGDGERDAVDGFLDGIFVVQFFLVWGFGRIDVVCQCFRRHRVGRATSRHQGRQGEGDTKIFEGSIHGFRP